MPWRMRLLGPGRKDIEDMFRLFLDLGHHVGLEFPLKLGKVLKLE